jgi:hypothetical protein
MSDKNIQLIPPPADPAAPKIPVEFEELRRRYDQDHGLFTK